MQLLTISTVASITTDMHSECQAICCEILQVGVATEQMIETPCSLLAEGLCVCLQKKRSNWDEHSSKGQKEKKKKKKSKQKDD